MNEQQKTAIENSLCKIGTKSQRITTIKIQEKKVQN